MAHYVIGDVQGCYDQLQHLLEKIHFNENQDQLIFAGDLVNRGPKSLETLRLAKQTNSQMVLGNHDLHLIAAHHNLRPANTKDTLSIVLAADDREELLAWLLEKPLMLYLEAFDCCIAHAGIPPIWALSEARLYANEVETLLQSEFLIDFLKHMYGNQPNRWHPELESHDRVRCIINYFTRMRFCLADGTLDLHNKGNQAQQGYQAWFTYPGKIKQTILFGHWATLQGKTGSTQHIALDTGCVWGHKLTALRLEDGCYFSADGLTH